MTPEATPRLFMLFRGPKWDLEDYFSGRLNLFSRDFCGDVLTTGSRRGVRHYGRFSVQCLDHHSRPLLGMLWHTLLYAFRQRWRRERVDLVVASDPIMMGLLGVLASRLLGARLIVEMNGDYSDLVLYTDPENGKVDHRRRWLFLTVINFVLARSDGIKTLYGEQLAPYGGALRNRPRVAAFHNYVNLAGFRNTGEEKVILLAGFPFLVKGVDILIRAFKEVSAQHPEWRLVILGWYPDAALPERHIAGHPRIELRKPVHHRDMPAVVGRAGICLLASRSEGMGRFLLEAMHAGKPRIGARVGGIPTLIEHEVDGLLFEPDDVAGLARCLDRLMGDAALRRRLGKAAQARAPRFDAESYYARLRAFYFDVLGIAAAPESVPGTDRRPAARVMPLRRR